MRDERSVEGEIFKSPSECLSPRLAVRAEHVSDPADEEEEQEENEAPFS